MRERFLPATTDLDLTPSFPLAVHFSNANLVNSTTWTTASSCDVSAAAGGFQYFIYQRFLQERNFRDDYFLTELAETMLLEDDIVAAGSLVASGFVQIPDVTNGRRVSFSAYPGTAVVFAVVVKYQNNASAVYVSSATYACNKRENMELNCQVLAYPFSWVSLVFFSPMIPDNNGFDVLQFVCGCALLLGVFLAFVGHRFFQLSQFLFGFAAGCFLGYVALAKLTEWSFTWTTVATGFSGAIGARPV